MSQQVIEERIYIGNVDYKATEDELKQFFSEFNVTDVDIPTKNIYSGKTQSTKPLGFAFVQFESKEQADKAIEAFNGKEFKSRKIYVKKAIPSPSEEEKAKKLQEYRAKKAAEKEAKKKAKAKAKSAEKVKSETSQSSKEENSQKDNEPNKATATKKKGVKTKLPLDQGKKSEDSIFITNLAFDVKPKTLQTLFKDYKPVWIHVPIRKIPYRMVQRQKLAGKAPRNKGMAFVKFTNSELQQKAIKEFNGKEINGRNIVVDVAIDARVPIDANGKEHEEEEGAAAAAAKEGEEQKEVEQKEVEAK